MIEQAVALAAVLPSLLLLWWFQAREVYPSPPRGLWSTFLLGMLVFVPMLVIAAPVRAVLSSVDDPLWRALGESLLLAAVPEEFFKLCVVALFAARVVRLDEPMDGIVYGVAASLGFAAIENAVYVQRGGWGTVALRCFTAVPCHALVGVFIGYFVARAVTARRGRIRWLAAGLVVPVGLHAAYDFPLFALGALRSGRWIPAGDTLVPIAALVATFLLALVGGSGGALVLAARARGGRIRRRLAGHIPDTPAVIRHIPALGPLPSPVRIALGIPLAGLGGFVLISFGSGAGWPAPWPLDEAASAVVGLLASAGVVMYGVGLAAQGARMRRSLPAPSPARGESRL